MSKPRRLPVKPGQLLVQWGRLTQDDDADICYYRGANVASGDISMVHNVISAKRYLPGSMDALDSLLTELIRRQYDLRTFKLSISKGPQASAPQACELWFEADIKGSLRSRHLITELLNIALAREKSLLELMQETCSDEASSLHQIEAKLEECKFWVGLLKSVLNEE